MLDAQWTLPGSAVVTAEQREFHEVIASSAGELLIMNLSMNAAEVHNFIWKQYEFEEFEEDDLYSEDEAGLPEEEKVSSIVISTE